MKLAPRTLAIVIVTVTAVAIAIIVGRQTFGPRAMEVKLDRNIYTVCGIDISDHNGDINFKKVAASGVKFVYMKATEGATWRDARFETNYNGALAAGLKVGIYHFFRFDVPGWRQSVNIMQAIGNKHLDLPVALDVEEWGNPPDIATNDIVDQLRSLIYMLRRQGREVIIYTNKRGYYRFVRGRFDDVALWICSFTDPAISERSRWTLWQHSHVGRIDGIKGPVDLSTFNIPARGDFDDWLNSHPEISSTH